MTEDYLTPEEVVKYFKDEFKTKVKSSRVEKRAMGVKKNEFVTIWIKVDRSVFKDVIKRLCDLQFPHLAIISGNDLGDNIELVYHFSIYYGRRMGEISLNICVDVPKSDPKIDSICDLIPGAVITEREKQEMLGVEMVGIPDSRRIFLPDDFPEGVYPWRKDKTGPDELARNLYEVEE